MILFEETVVKYRDGTIKTLDELGGEAKELASNTPVKSGGTTKPLDEFIQDQIILSPDTVVTIEDEDPTTLEDYIEEQISLTPSTPVVDGEDTTTLEQFVESHGGGGGGSVSATADGVKTIGELIQSLLDTGFNNITFNSFFVVEFVESEIPRMYDKVVLNFVEEKNGYLYFQGIIFTNLNVSSMRPYQLRVTTNGEVYKFYYLDTAGNDISSVVKARNAFKVTLYF